jgi:D123 protein
MPAGESEARQNPGFWNVVVPTFLEQWPKSLHDLSIPSKQLQLTVTEAIVLGASIIELGETFDNVPENAAEIRSSLIARLDDALKSTFPNGAFVRLGSRSPKGAFFVGANRPVNGRITSGQSAFDLLTACSERIADDLHAQIVFGYAPSIWLREGLFIERWAEFRCFMQNRQLVAISQYFYRDVEPRIVLDRDGIYAAVELFFTEEFRAACPLDTVVFDVFLEVAGRGGYRVRLLEINPFGRLTDPCLFDWGHPEGFRGQLRFCTEGSGPGFTDAGSAGR